MGWYSGQFEAVQSVEVRPACPASSTRSTSRTDNSSRRGDLLFTVDARPFAIAVDQAKGRVDRTKAQSCCRRARSAGNAPCGVRGRHPARPRDTFGQSRDCTGSAACGRGGLKNAELNLEWTEVRAPIDGAFRTGRLISAISCPVGPQVQPSFTTIVSLDPIHFVFEVSEADYLRYVRLLLSGSRQSGRDMEHPVRLKLADDKDWVHTGHLNFVDNQLNAKSGTLRAAARSSPIPLSCSRPVSSRACSFSEVRQRRC